MNAPFALLVVNWFSTYWLSLILFVVGVAIFEGFYRKTKAYLGDEINARIRIEEYPQNAGAEPHLSLRIFNDEKFDLSRCFATLLDLKHFYNPKTIIPIKDEVNPNSLSMSWGSGGGSDNEYVTISRNGKDRVLNICKSTGVGLVFLFHGHEKHYSAHGKFMARVEINGYLGDKPIQPIQCGFCFEYGTQVSTERRIESGIGERQPIRIVASSSKAMFTFVDCPDEIKTKKAN